jgi:hypothetical protein
MEKEQDPGTERGDTPEGADLMAAAEGAKEASTASSTTRSSLSRKNGWRDRLKPFLGRKAVLSVASALILVVVGVAFYGASEGTRGPESRQASLSGDQALQDGLRQEEMPRFYIPLPSTSQSRVTVVDFSVVWDALSAMRFKRMESPVRDRLYALMLGMVGKGEDLQDRTSTLETEMGRILREALRTDNLAVRVREVRSH